MSILDPRQYLKDILTTIAVTKDNGVSPAQVAVIYEGGPESLRHLFYINGYNGVISIVRHREREAGMEKRIQDIPIRYDMEVPFHVTAVDSVGCTATKLLNKIRREIIMLVEANAQGVFPWASYATIRVRQDNEANTIIGGFDPLWIDDYLVELRPLQNIAFIAPPIVTGYYGFEMINLGLKFEDGFERVVI